jgi:hypothetical protein
VLHNGPVKKLGDTDKISSGYANVGCRIMMGFEFKRAAHLLMTMKKVTMVRGEVPGSCAAFRQTLNDPIIDSIQA